MSRRGRRRSGAPAEGRAGDRPDGGAPGRPPQKLSLAAQAGILIAVFAATVGIAELAGAANLGVSFGIAQIVFAIVLVGLLLRA